MGARSAFALVALVATPTHALSDEALAKFQAATAANKIAEPFDPPHEADEWYMVTIANVSVGYMHTTVAVNDEFVRTMEVMDVQVSRGQDTSRMAFETVFDEIPFTTAPAPETVAAAAVSRCACAVLGTRMARQPASTSAWRIDVPPVLGM